MGLGHASQHASTAEFASSPSLNCRFWINNQSRMYLLEGAGELHRQFRMAVGDVMVFAQKQDRTLVVAGRPATKVSSTM
jgi:hypothetical protein